jgi:hypothetical protein
VARRGPGAPGEQALLTALATGATWAEAAVAAGVSPRTVARRMRDPAFREQLNRVRGRSLAVTAAGLAGLADAVLARLTQLVSSANEPVALGACRTVLESMVRIHELAILETRLDALEARLAQGEQR